jgi:hypothetical integral membrane protein (TIGR02206 family)
VVAPLSAEHLLAVSAVAAVAAALVAGARCRPGRWLGAVRWALALLLVVNECGWWLYLALAGAWRADDALPLQLCDAASFVAAAALITRRPWLVELTYFWGLAGTTQALLTPDLAQHFPRFLFFQYFVGHGGIVTAALLLVAGLGIAPRRGSVVRVTLLTVAFAILALAGDLVTGGDYLYLRRAPAGFSALELMGPWPWYLLSATVVALALFAAVDLPFRAGRRATPPRRSRPGPTSPDGPGAQAGLLSRTFGSDA